MEYVQAHCFPAFQEFIGVAWEQSQLDLFYFSPTPSGWDAGDREVQCAVYDPSDDALTESSRDARR